MESFESADGHAIFTLVTKELETNGLNVENQLTGLATDGAAVMTGRKNGVAAKLCRLCPILLSVHCVCHNLALACTDTSKELQYIKKVEETLTTLWRFFENSPKRLGMFLNIQLNVKKAKVTNESNKTILLHRLKKACSTRWLSFDQSVASVKVEYEPLLLTLQQLENDAVAIGLLKMLKSLKFIGTIYILSKVLPVLSQLSKTFQVGNFNFSQIQPQIQLAKHKLAEINESDSALDELRQDIDAFSNLSQELVMSGKQAQELTNLQTKYIASLQANIDKRFPSVKILEALGVFNPLEVPPVKESNFKEYGTESIKIIAEHFYGEDEKVKAEQLLAEWQSLKYLINTNITRELPSEIKLMKSSVTPTQWFISLLLKRRSTYSSFFPRLLWIAEVAASLPVSNAWPERGASALKLIKTRCRSRLMNDMLECLMHVLINGPPTESQAAQTICNNSVNAWLMEKKRRKLPSMCKTSQALHVSHSESSDNDQAEDTVTSVEELSVLERLLNLRPTDGLDTVVHLASSDSDEFSDLDEVFSLV